MDAQAIRELIKEKYGEAAARAKTGGSSCCGAAPALMNVDPITSNLYSDQECQGYRQMPLQRRSVAGIPRHWRNFRTAKLCWTSDPAGDRCVALRQASRTERQGVWT